MPFKAQNNAKAWLILCDSIYYSNPDSSVKIAEHLLSLAKNKEDEKLTAASLRRIARYNILKSDYDNAFINLNAAITIFEKRSEKTELGSCLSLKSIIFKRLSKNKECVEANIKALSEFKAVNDSSGCIKVLLNLSSDCIEFKNINEAQKAINELDVYKNSFGKHDYYYFYQNKGRLSFIMGYKNEALIQLNKALEVATLNNMIDSKATILMHIAEVYIELGDYKNALNSLNKSEIICVENNLNHELIETYEVLIDCYKLMGNYPMAFNLLKLQNDKKNDLLNFEKLNKINLLEKKLLLYENEKKIDIEKIKASKIKQLNSWLIFVMVLFMGLIFGLIYFYLKVKKLRNLSEAKSKIIELKASELLARQLEMKGSLNYAYKIQKALLPSESAIKKILKGKS